MGGEAAGLTPVYTGFTIKANEKEAQTMTAHRLTPRQLAAVYRWLRRDFPLAERKPLWMMLIS